MSAQLELLPPPRFDREIAPDYEIRVLTVDETQSLAPIFKERGVALPDPATSFIVAAVTPDGKVTNNFLVAQLMVHAEPLNLEVTGQHLFRRLVRTVEAEIAKRIGTCDVFLFAPPGKIQDMAQAMGMVKEPWAVMSRHVEAVPWVEVPKEVPKEVSELDESKEVG